MSGFSKRASEFLDRLLEIAGYRKYTKNFIFFYSLAIFYVCPNYHNVNIASYAKLTLFMLNIFLNEKNEQMKYIVVMN